ncbi:hypothetical protein GCM10010965_14070 [Caldalkalibacillus thermarum]|nr:hypothetical protein GCM10010965_14070 [Caldalkalibacillus thermarum]
MSKIEEKLKRLGINLPEAPRPAAEYVPARTVGNLVYTSELPSCWKKFLGNGVNMPDPQFRLMNFHLIPRWKLK